MQRTGKAGQCDLCGVIYESELVSIQHILSTKHRRRGMRGLNEWLIHVKSALHADNLEQFQQIAHVQGKALKQRVKNSRKRSNSNTGLSIHTEQLHTYKKFTDDDTLRDIAAEKPSDDRPAQLSGVDPPAPIPDENSLGGGGGGGGEDKIDAQASRGVLSEKSPTDNAEPTPSDSVFSSRGDASKESSIATYESPATIDNRTRPCRKRPRRRQSSHGVAHGGRFCSAEPGRHGQNPHTQLRHPHKRYHIDPYIRTAGGMLSHPPPPSYDLEHLNSHSYGERYTHLRNRRRGMRNSQRQKQASQSVGQFGRDIAVSSSTTFSRMHEVWEISEELEKLKQQQASLELCICRLNAALEQTKKERTKLKERRSALLKEMDQSDSAAESEPDSPAQNATVVDNSDPPGPSAAPSSPLSDAQPVRRWLLPTPSLPPRTDLTAFTPSDFFQDLEDPSDVVVISKSPSPTQDSTTVTVRASEVQICDGTDASGKTIASRPVVSQNSVQSTAAAAESTPPGSPSSMDEPLRTPKTKQSHEHRPKHAVKRPPAYSPSHSPPIAKEIDLAKLKRIRQMLASPASLAFTFDELDTVFQRLTPVEEEEAESTPQAAEPAAVSASSEPDASTETNHFILKPSSSEDSSSDS
ncbi:hypothetical protein SprV_0401615200 [Sparganum proliferum]